MTGKRLSKQSFHIYEQKVYIDINSYEYDMQPHCHEFYELIYVIRGSAVHIINEERHKACMGDLFFLNYDTVHTLEDMSENYKMIVVSFLPEILDESLENCQDAGDMLLFLLNQQVFEKKDSAGYIVLHACAGQFESVLKEMYEEFTNKRELGRFIIKNLLSVVLGRIYRMTVKEGEADLGDSLASVRGYLDQNYTGQIKLKELAKIALLSPAYLSARFKIRYGQSISDYVNSKRIERACFLIRTTDLPVSEIMKSSGFNDGKFFYKSFKNNTGMTPGEYRKNTLKEAKNSPLKNGLIHPMI